MITFTDTVAAMRPRPRRIINPITLLLLWSSKTNPSLVAVCSRWAIATRAAFGLLVLFTTALAFCSAYYTLSTLNVAAQWVPWIAAAYTCFIFTLDREIAGGLDNRAAFIRPVLALMIGVVVAVPVELWIFEGRVDQRLAKQYRENNREQLDQVRDARAVLERRRADLQANLAELRKEEANWGRISDDELVGRKNDGRTGNAGAGPVYENARVQQEGIRERIREVRRDLDNLDKSLPAELQRLDRDYQRLEVPKVVSFPTRYEALQDVLDASPALYRLSWGVTLFLICIEMSVACMKFFTPHVDYDHLVKAEIQENILRADEIAFQNYAAAKKDPTTPRLSVAEQFAVVRYAPVPVPVQGNG